MTLRFRSSAPAVALALALAAVAVATPSAADARVVTSGKIVPGRGAAGVTLGMTRAEVVDRLGGPVFENQHGYMQYIPDGRFQIFDVFVAVDTDDPVVDQIVIAADRFRVGSNYVFRKGGLRRLLRRYGSKLTRQRVFPSQDPVYRYESTYRGRRVWTDFMVTRFGSRGEVTNVIMLFAAADD